MPRAEGQIPRSQELTTALLLLGATLVLQTLGPSLAGKLAAVFGSGLLLAGMTPLDAGSAVLLLRGMGGKAMVAVAMLVCCRSG